MDCKPVDESSIPSQASIFTGVRIGMPTEIERKFLIDPSKLPAPSSPVFMQQGYLSKDPWVRIRVTDTYAELTIKGPGNLSRAEFNYIIPKYEAEEMKPMLKGTLSKNRHSVVVGGKAWDVDEFLSPPSLAGFWLAEIELIREGEDFEMPVWALKEVTEDHRYSNAWLVEHGVPAPHVTD